MIKLNLDKIINYGLIALGLLYFTHCGKSKEVAVIPEGYISPTEFEYRIKVRDIIKLNKSLKHEIQGFKNKYEKDTLNIHIANKHELRDLFTRHIKER